MGHGPEYHPFSQNETVFSRVGASLLSSPGPDELESGPLQLTGDPLAGADDEDLGGGDPILTENPTETQF